VNDSILSPLILAASKLKRDERLAGDRGCVECINVNRQFQASQYRDIFKVALPVGLEATFQASFSLIDQIIVGSLGAVSVAAVGLSNNLSFILTLLYAAIGTGSGAFIAQAFGRRNMDEVSKIAALGQTAAFSLGICSSIPLAPVPQSDSAIRGSAGRIG
jgi:Na+-driven multidrug efflux pump